jgi:calcium-dependent protein kinase
MLSRERLEIAFRAFDTDGSGTITADELRAMLGKHHDYDEQMWNELIAEVDSNGDGVIDMNEFCDMMMKVNQG